MKGLKKLKKAFGLDEFGIINFPNKISNVMVARLIYGDERGCSWCFPHGFETTNSTISNRQRNWKKFRKTKWKPIKNVAPPQYFYSKRGYPDVVGDNLFLITN